MTPGSPYPTSTNAGAHVRWPVTRFYWSVIDTSNLPTRRPDATQLGYLFEDVLPVSIDEIHAVFLPLDEHRHLACGVAHDHLTDHELNDALTLGPQTLPPHLCIEDGTGDARYPIPDPAVINLLCGPHEPAPVKRLRRRARMLTAMTMAIVVTLIIFGMERRRAAALQSIDRIKAEQDAVIASVIPSEARNAFAGPPELQLTAELRRLRQTRAGSAPDESHADITGAVIALFSAWPHEVHLETESITIDPQRILMVGRVPSMGDASRINEQLNRVVGWTIDAPDATRRGDHTAVSVSLKRQAQSPKVGGGGAKGATP